MQLILFLVFVLAIDFGAVCLLSPFWASASILLGLIMATDFAVDREGKPDSVEIIRFWLVYCLVEMSFLGMSFQHPVLALFSIAIAGYLYSGVVEDRSARVMRESGSLPPRKPWITVTWANQFQSDIIEGQKAINSHQDEIIKQQGDLIKLQKEQLENYRDQVENYRELSKLQTVKIEALENSQGRYNEWVDSDWEHI